MSGLLQSLTFAQPWLLAGLAALPVLWWLLRVLPPAPRLVAFPAVRLLFGLRDEQKTPDKAPWWLVLLRLLAAALIILALAQPVLNANRAATGAGPLILVIDDDWAAAPRWDRRIAALQSLLADAERNERPVRILTTAARYDGAPPQDAGLMRPSEARVFLEALEPKPWPGDRSAALRIARQWEISGGADIVWASNGLVDGSAADLARQLQRFGPVTLLNPEPGMTPVAVTPPSPGAVALDFTLRRPASSNEEGVTLVARGADGRVLDRIEVVFTAGETETGVRFDLPLELRNDLSSVTVERIGTAAGTALLDERWRRRPVGLVSETALDTGLSLLSEGYYVQRALEPLGAFSQGPVDVLMRAGQAVIVAPDGATLSPQDRNQLESWVREGGVLVRFAGPRLARAEPGESLIPVQLRRGGRSLSGAMMWTEPLSLSPFPKAGPFAELTPPADVTVRQQVLAEPSLDLDAKTWARLSDGTPLITGDRRGDGWVVLIHTTANAQWSNLALSGLFVELLERIVTLSGGVTNPTVDATPLPPRSILDGFGQLREPSSGALALDFSQASQTEIGPRHPPGLYGSGQERRALNLGPRVGAMAPFAEPPSGVSVRGYEATHETDFKPALLTAALVLLIVDGFITLLLRGYTPSWPRRRAAGTVSAAALLVLVLDVDPARGQSAAIDDPLVARILEGTVLAYVETGDPQVDRTSAAGLYGLALILNQRTAVEAAEPAGVDVRRDELAFFPMLYWPVTDNQQPLDTRTVNRLNRFMANGGTIFFDTRDRQTGSIGRNGADSLRRIVGGLDVPALVPVPPDHVLTKSFYLMQEFPGRWTGDTLWVEPEGTEAQDGVSRIIVGSHDWAAAWAVDETGRPMFATVPNNDRHREMAYRFGVNLVMYTLTGNYKEDQVHVPAILERLGQ